MAMLISFSLLIGFAVCQQTTFEHDVGKGFESAGVIVDLPTGDDKLNLELQFKGTAPPKLAGSQGYYRLRAPLSPPSNPLQVSITRGCLSAAGLDDRLVVHTDARGRAVALTYASRGSCRAAGDGPGEGAVSLAVNLPLSMAAPVLAPQLRAEHVQGAAHSIDTGGQAPAAGRGPGAGAAKGVPGQPGTAQGRPGQLGAAPPQEEKTWLQKNWIFLLPLCFIVLNFLGQAGQQGGEQAGADNGPRSAPATRRR